MSLIPDAPQPSLLPFLSGSGAGTADAEAFAGALLDALAQLTMCPAALPSTSSSPLASGSVTGGRSADVVLPSEDRPRQATDAAALAGALVALPVVPQLSGSVVPMSGNPPEATVAPSFTDSAHEVSGGTDASTEAGRIVAIPTPEVALASPPPVSHATPARPGMAKVETSPPEANIEISFPTAQPPQEDSGEGRAAPRSGAARPAEGAHPGAEAPQSVPTREGRPQEPVLSTAAHRVLDAVERLRQAPPPRQLLVELPELDGLRLVVETRGATVHLRVVGGELPPARLDAFTREVAGGLESRGFDLSGFGERREGRPTPEFDEFAPPARPVRTRPQGMRI